MKKAWEEEVILQSENLQYISFIMIFNWIFPVMRSNEEAVDYIPMLFLWLLVWDYLKIFIPFKIRIIWYL